MGPKNQILDTKNLNNRGCTPIDEGDIPLSGTF